MRRFLIKFQTFSDKIETVQYNATLAITGAICGSSKVKLYKELGLESLKDRRWMRRLSYFYKIFSTQSPSYLSKYLPPFTISQRYPNYFTSVRCRTVSFQNFFGQSQWNQLNTEIRNILSYIPK